MRTFVTTFLLLLMTVAPLLAQETPQGSYQAFVDAVLDEDLGAPERKFVFERYFDFDEWLVWQSEKTGETYTPEQREQLRDEWFQLFASEEFRETYEANGVTVENETSRDDKAGKAELLISMGEDGAEKFRVLMKRSDDSEYWRWYAIPRLETAPEVEEEKSPAERLAQINEQLELIAEREAELNELKRQLREEARRLQSEIVESSDSDSPYATPRSVVETAWQAVDAGEADEFTQCHIYSADTQGEFESGAIAKKLKALGERVMGWEALDTTVDETDPSRAYVRIKLTLQKTGDVDERIVTVKVRRIGEEWKIDETP